MGGERGRLCEDAGFWVGWKWKALELSQHLSNAEEKAETGREGQEKKKDKVSELWRRRWNWKWVPTQQN